MKIRKISMLLAAGFSACMTAGVAQSADNWSGMYGGANLGYGWSKSNMSTHSVFSSTGYFATTSIPAIASASDGSAHGNGVNGGVNFGYNLRAGNLVYGAEIDLSALDAKNTRTATAVYPCCSPTSFTNTESVQTNGMLSLKGRVGYALNNSLFYGTAGMAVSKIRSSNHFTDTFATANETTDASKYKAGWLLGVGYEYALANNLSLKAEYQHTKFNNVSGTSHNLTAFSPAIAFPTNTFTNSGDLALDMIRIGINKQF